MKIKPEFYNQTFLVTGATGFIGTALVKHLLEQGSIVHAISRSSRESRNDLHWWEGNCSDFDFMERVVKVCKPDIVYHLAGYVHGTRDLSAVLPSYHSNLTSTVNLLTILTGVGCKKIILAGSMEEPPNDQEPVLPSSPYAASKWACEGYANMFHALYDLPVVNIRLFMVYGPGQGQTKKLIPYLINSYLNGEQPEIASGDRLIDWIYIDDVIEGLIVTTNNEQVVGDRVDIGSGRQISVGNLAVLIYEIMDAEKEPLIGNHSSRQMEQVKVADRADTIRKLDWEPDISLKQGLQKTITWHQKVGVEI